MDKRYLTAKETANYLGVAEDTIRKWYARGHIPGFKFGDSVNGKSKALRFDLRAIDKWTKTKQCKII